MTAIASMPSFKIFRGLMKSLGTETIINLCEQFVYDHEGAIEVTRQCSANAGLNLSTLQIKDFISQMHKYGDFDEVECWGLKLGSNDLYKKFHP